jgi:acyl dehydratase
MRALENITYDELHVGDYATFTKTLSDENLIVYAASSGDIPASDLNIESIKLTLHDPKIGYGMWVSTLISNAFSKVIPGPGSIYLEQKLKFSFPIELGDMLTVKLIVKEKLDNCRVLFACEITNQNTDMVVSGDSTVIAPSEKVSVEQKSFPIIDVEN